MEGQRCPKCKNHPYLVKRKNEILSFGVRERPAGSDEPEHFIVIGGGKNGCGVYVIPHEFENYEIADLVATALNLAIKARE